MMNHRIGLWIGLSCILFSTIAVAQETCPALVENALATTKQVCADIAANTLCYGHPSVNAEINANPAFAVPGDMTSLSDVTSLQLSPLDENRAEWGVIYAQVDVPNTPVVLLAFGDTRIKNESAAPMIAATVSAAVPVHLRSGPGTFYDIVTTVESGTPILLDGRNEAANWLRVKLPDNQNAWIVNFLVQSDEPFDSLPVVQPEDVVYAPMQKFHLQTGHDDAPCTGAPQSGLLLQTSTPDAEAETIINDIHLFLNGTAFMQNGQPLQVSVLDGQVRIEANSTSLRLPAGGRAAVDLNNQDAPITIEPYTLSDLATLPLTSLPQAVTLASPLTEAQISAAQIHCQIVARTAVNVRTGPSTLYPRQSTLEAGGSYAVTAQANGLDGKIWWLLDNGGWVRSDVVKAEDSCQQVMVTTDLPPTPTPVPTQSPTKRYLSYELSNCHYVGYGDIRSGDVITFMTGPQILKPTREELEAALSNSAPTFSVDNIAQQPVAGISITHERDGFQASEHYVWIATPGTHTLAGGWSGFWQQTCVVTVGD